MVQTEQEQPQHKEYWYSVTRSFTS